MSYDHCLSYDDGYTMNHKPNRLIVFTLVDCCICPELINVLDINLRVYSQSICNVGGAQKVEYLVESIRFFDFGKHSYHIVLVYKL